MKHPKILAIIKEVIDTNMYNEKKNEAIAKKRIKLKNCNQMLKKIDPEFKKLINEKRSYKEYQESEPKVQ
ncbi:hypothetical protein C1645_836075 [Glomus cerebriforme]|uniref:Uncharacterized protein n=1 Tax=Glomus cerebriforme TaxID=658196 RepID=A0A397SCF4_9GLOM|nr:hypothetical protein C1645_836075 [Glomus cerebriforme]